MTATPVHNGARFLYVLLSALLAVSAFVGVMTWKNSLILAEIKGNYVTGRDLSGMKDAIMSKVDANTRSINNIRVDVATQHGGP
jgi:hypothetical protein